MGVGREQMGRDGNGPVSPPSPLSSPLAPRITGLASRPVCWQFAAGFGFAITRRRRKINVRYTDDCISIP